jgi:hypothetical protein
MSYGSKPKNQREIEEEAVCEAAAKRLAAGCEFWKNRKQEGDDWDAFLRGPDNAPKRD